MVKIILNKSILTYLWLNYDTFVKRPSSPVKQRTFFFCSWCSQTVAATWSSSAPAVQGSCWTHINTITDNIFYLLFSLGNRGRRSATVRPLGDRCPLLIKKQIVIVRVTNWFHKVCCHHCGAVLLPILLLQPDTRVAPVHHARRARTRPKSNARAFTGCSIES